jgi:flagellar biosynthesis protein FliQ
MTGFEVGGVASVASDGFWSAIWMLVPIALVAAVVAAGVSALANSIGISDPTASRVARTLAVLLTVGLLLDSIASSLVHLTRSDLAAVAEVDAVSASSP